MEILAEYGVAQTVYFPLVTAGATGFQTTWTPASAECQLSKDGAAFANSSNSPSHEGNGIWSLSLTATEMQATRIAVFIGDGETDIEDQCLIITTTLGQQIAANRGLYVILCDNATFTPTTTAAEFTMVAPNLTEEATADHFAGRLMTGVGDGDATQAQQTKISASELANSKVKLTFATLTEAPPNGSYWIVT